MRVTCRLFLQFVCHTIAANRISNPLDTCGWYYVNSLYTAELRKIFPTRYHAYLNQITASPYLPADLFLEYTIGRSRVYFP